MKKRLLFIIVVIIVLITEFIIYGKRDNRYDEIRASVNKAVELAINAQFPKCTISNNYDNFESNVSYDSLFLISNGYIKKDELLDVDKENYCDALVNIMNQNEDDDCKIFYKVYLKCKDYEDK